MGERVLRPLRVLVGGGIGAGKSTVLSVLAEMGYATVQADTIGRDVLAPGGSAVDAVGARWPSVIVDDVISRAALANIVFADPEALADLESISHPHIVARIAEMSSQLDGQPFAVEVPIPDLVTDESWYRIAVVAPLEVRIGRAVDRGSDEADVRARAAVQVPDDRWRAWADVTIVNTGDPASLRSSVVETMSGGAR